jgi:hypothetical protein
LERDPEGYQLYGTNDPISSENNSRRRRSMGFVPSRDVNNYPDATPYLYSRSSQMSSRRFLLLHAVSC